VVARPQLDGHAYTYRLTIALVAATLFTAAALAALIVTLR
jgi:hypothetical protein